MNTEETATISELLVRHQDGFCLEQPFYTAPEIFERDVERIFARYWQFVGHTARIPNKGDYFLLNIAGESIIITRDQSGTVKALANVCRHRGSRVCLEQSGNAKAFTCPYHAWVYSCSGDLVSAKTMPQHFDKADYGLKEFAVQVVAGLIYINLRDGNEPFDHIAADVSHYMQPYRLEDTEIAHRQTWTVTANWKLVWENFSECYHCGPSHPEYCSVMAHALAESTGSSRTREEYVSYSEQWRDDVRRRGLLSESRPRTSTTPIHSCSRHAIKPGSLTQSPDGQPVAPLLGDMAAYDGGTSTFSLYPGHFVTVTSDHAVLFRFTPIEAVKTEVELMWLVRKGAREGVDYDRGKLTWVWLTTTDQDKKIVDDNQAGVNSRFYQPGPYAECEQGVMQFIDWYLNEIA